MGRFIILSLISAIALFCQSEDEKAWSILNKSLADKPADTRANAVHAVGLIEQDSKAQSAAEKLLADTDPKVRAAAERALGKMGTKASISKLQSALVDKDSEVVFAAAGPLHKLVDPTAHRVYDPALMKDLVPAFNDSNASVSLNAAAAYLRMSAKADSRRKT